MILHEPGVSLRAREGNKALVSSSNPIAEDLVVTVVELLGPLLEVLGRPLVVLEPGFVQMRYDKDSFAKIVSRKRQLAFGVTLGLREATFRISYVRKALETGDATAVVLKEGETIKGMWYVTTYTDILPLRIALYLEPDVPDEFGEKARREVLCDEPQFGAGEREELQDVLALEGAEVFDLLLCFLNPLLYDVQLASRLYPLVLAAEQEVRSVGGEEGVESLIERLEGLKAKEAVLVAVKIPFDLEPEALNGLDGLLSDEEVLRMMSWLPPLDNFRSLLGPY
jgi:hypothetical protein